ncbi:MAG: hypothetical protein QQN41_06625 [Nitrosopumilus sp.]
MNKIKRIGIIGSEGYVGKAQLKLWNYSNIYNVFEYDLGIGQKDQINSCDLAVVCVPTPEIEDGSCDISIIEDTIKWLNVPVILIKSTIPPGTTDSLRKKYGKRIVHSPEFIGENKYWSPYKFHNDALKTPFIILGGIPKDRNYVYDLLLPIFGPFKVYKFVDSKTSEMVKYVSNCWGATKVTWANEMKGICDVLGIDFGEVREAWALDPKVEKSHTLVFKDKPGFGGKCLPKDTKALVKFAEDAGYDAELIKEVLNSNARFKRL